jgi:hypothetical protein
MEDKATRAAVENFMASEREDGVIDQLLKAI